MENSFDHKRVLIIAIASIMLSTTILCWTRYATRAEATEGTTREDRLNAPQNARNTAGDCSGPAGAAQVRSEYGNLPLSFEANCGQTDPRVAFISRGSGSTLFLTPNGAVLALRCLPKRPAKDVNAKLSPVHSGAIAMTLVGANRASQISGSDRLPGNINYFRGNDPTTWRSNVPTYARVQYDDVYPGVNLVYYGNERQLEYDFQVARGADATAIRLAFDGVAKIRLATDGALVLRKPGRELRMEKPSAYQELDGARQPVSVRYVMKGLRQIAFELGEYDKTRALVIDPVLIYSTFLGGNGNDDGRSIAIDAAGNAYVTGRTTSFNFPTSLSGYDTTYANSTDVFITKLNAAGSAIIYSTYLGGNSDDNGFGLAIDSSGNAYVTGSTSSTDFPTTAGVFQTTLRGGSFPGDAFVTKLNADGTALVYSTYLGGSSSDQANGIAIDSAGNAYVAGFTNSSNFPTTAGAFQTTLGGGSFVNDAFVTKLNDTGTALIYSTYIGGTNSDQANAIKADSSGNAYITGTTLSTNFDVTPGAFQTTYGGGPNFSSLGDAFVTKVNPTGAALVYSTYIGGSSDDGGFGIDLANSGEVYLTGSSASINFPTTPGVVRVGNGGVAKSTNGAGAWTNISAGLTNSTELSLAIDPSNPSVVFVGSSGGGVSKSSDGGANWAAANAGLTDLTIKALTIDPTATSIMYLGTSSRGVFRSTDNGGTWRAINTGENGMSVNTLKIDPAASSTIYAGTDSGVFKTTNGGASWIARNTGLNQGLFVNALAIDPVATATIYANVSFGGVYKSTDAGAHWSATSLTGANVRTLVVDPLMPAIIYAGGDNGIQKSTDAGNTWSPSNMGLTNRSVNALAISPADSLTVYAGTANGVFKSTNGGSAWSRANNGLLGAVVNTLAIDPLSALTIYSGSAAGSTDVFVTKLNAAGTALDYSTLMGGTNPDQGFSVAIDATGNAFITGITSSQNFPTTPGVFEAPGFDTDAFVTKLNSTATALIYSTYLGGTGFDEGFGVVADASGSAYVTGLTQSQTFPITAGAFQSVINGFSGDAFISKLAVTPILTADIGISMTGPINPVTAGDSVSYSITVTNNGPERATSIMVTDDLPSSLVFSFCNSSVSSCTHFGNSVSFSISSLDVGASVNMSIFANVSCPLASNGSIDNTATVSSSASDSNPSNDSATVSVNATNATAMLFPTNRLFDSAGGSDSVSVNWNSGCSWTSHSNASWITVTFSSNCCNGVVNYTVAPNPGVFRTGTITIAGQTFTVNQTTGCTFSIDHSSKSFTSAGGTDSVALTTSDASCNWTATSNAPFITITSAGSGAGNAMIGYSVDPNPTGLSRSGTMTIAGRTFTVDETGVSCTFGLGSLGQSFGAPGGASSVSVTAPAGCDWMAVSNDSWITITSGASSSGNGSVGYTVAVNSGPARVGTMTVAGQNFTVSQSVSTPTIGLYDPAHGAFFLRNSNSGGVADISFNFGPGGVGFIPITGDWNGDGIKTAGLYDPAHGAFFLRNSNTNGIADMSFTFAPPGGGFLPIVGDWDGDGIDTVGLYDRAHAVFFLKNSTSNGGADISFAFGPSGLGWIPLVGDWNADRVDTIGLYDPVHAAYFLRNSNSGGVADISFTFGPSGLGWTPLVGDWNADGVDTIGLYDPMHASFFLRNSNSMGVADVSFSYGPAGLGWLPIVGDWNGL